MGLSRLALGTANGERQAIGSGGGSDFRAWEAERPRLAEEQAPPRDAQSHTVPERFQEVRHRVDTVPRSNRPIRIS